MFVFTCSLIIFLGNSVIANELLSNTKGRLMGWGFVALGYGMAFTAGIISFGFISAHVNPAMCLALLILGEIDGKTFIAAVAGEFLGAFIASWLVWLHYIMHFKTVPEPPSQSPEDMLLRSRDALTPTALGIASYNTKEEDVAARERGLGDLRNTLSDIRYFLSQTKPSHPDSDEALVKIALGEDKETKEYGEQGNVEHRLRRRSVQVSDVHRRLKDVSLHDFKQLMTMPRTLSGSNVDQKFDVSTNEAIDKPKQNGINGSSSVSSLSKSEDAKSGVDKHPVVSKEQKRLDKLYQQTLIADANAKLSIFCTRPALYSPVFNFLTEFLATTALLFGALMIYGRSDMMYEDERQNFEVLSEFVIHACMHSLVHLYYSLVKMYFVSHYIFKRNFICPQRDSSLGFSYSYAY